MNATVGITEIRPLYDTFGGTGRRARCRSRGLDPDQMVEVLVLPNGDCTILRYLPKRAGKQFSNPLAG